MVDLTDIRTPTANLLDVSTREENPEGPTLAAIRAAAQVEADQSRADIVVGWCVNDRTGQKEYGYCPASVAPCNAFVIEVLETIRPYTGGRADHSSRQLRRLDRLTNSADRARQESARRSSAAQQMASVMTGEPIKIGHHSERRHRRHIERMDDHMRASIAAQKRAAQLQSRADGVGEGGISADDPQAVAKLRERLADLEQLQAHMKACNRLIRQNKTDEARIEALVESGLVPSVAAAAALIVPDCLNRRGYPEFRTKLNNANMRRIRGRIEDLQRTAANTQDGEQLVAKCGVRYVIADNRVQLIFPGKPAYDVRARLKQKGFRWAPSAGAWQRQLSESGKYHAREFIEWLDKTEGGAT